MRRGILFVLTAPSGCGKGTLRRALLAEKPHIKFCPSLTTRSPRTGEVDGIDYLFVSREEFLLRKERGELVEWAEVYGNLYGTPRRDIEDTLSQGQDVILEKDIQGAKALRKAYPEGVFIFILPPSFEELRRRMEARGTESDKERHLRLESARREMSDLSAFDYVIINSDANRAKERLVAITAGETARVESRDPGVQPDPQRRSTDDEPVAKGPGEESQLQVHPGDSCGQESASAGCQERADCSFRPQTGDQGFGGDR